MQTIIFCNLSNEALEPITSETPLELLEMCSKKIIDYTLENLAENEITSCTVVTNNIDTKEYIDRTVASEIHSDTFLCGDEMPAEEILKKLWNKEDDIMIVQADGIIKLNLSDMKKFHEKKKGLACIYALKTSDADLYDDIIVEFDKQNRFECFYKKSPNEFPSTNYKSAPVYIISKEMLSSQLDGIKHDAEKKGIFSWLNIKKEQNVYVYTDELCEAGSPAPFYQKIETVESMLKAAEEMISGDAFELGTSIEDKVISNTPYIFRGVSFIPPVYIGRNVSIGMGSVIGKGTVIENNSSIGESVNITGSYIGEYSKIGNRAKIESAVICKNSTLEKGAECEKLSVSGDGSTIEENSVICHGVKLWNNKTLVKNTKLKTNLRYGVRPDFSFSDEGCDKLISPVQAVSIGCALGSSLDSEKTVLVCCDNTDCLSYSTALISGIMSTGISVWNLGISHERAADFAAKILGADVYAVVSANPAPKLILRCPGGLRIKRNLERDIEKHLKTKVFRQKDILDFGSLKNADNINEMYISHLKSAFPKKLKGINVTVKTSNTKTADEIDRLITPVNDINGEEIIFHFLDNTGKVTAYSEKTGYILHERLILLCVKIHFEKNEDIAVPFTLPCVFDELAGNYSANLYRYFSSSCSSADKFARKLAANENNSFVHDGMYLIADILNYLTNKNISLSDALSDIPQFYSSERFISLSDNDKASKNFFSEIKSKFKHSDDGIVISKNDARAIIRPMKRGKGLMLFVDAHKAETAAAICDDIEQKLNGQCTIDI